MAPAASGFVLVPVTPTAAMIAAGADQPSVADTWAAMIAAFNPATAISGDDVIHTLRAMRVRLSRTGCDLPAEAVAVLPAVGTAQRNPAFWSDPDVRRMAVELHRRVPVQRALDLIRNAVGPDRTPSKSALSRAWKRIDLLKHPKRSR